MSEVRCFWVEDTGRMQVSLRCYIGSDEHCEASGYGYHNISVCVGVAPSQRVQPEGSARYIECLIDKEQFANDPRWPTHCPCGKAFELENRQVFTEAIYRVVDGRGEWVLRDLPPGAMYDAWWYEGTKMPVGHDGIHLMVTLPPVGGLSDQWYVDGSANNGPGWQRTGVPPNVTAHPSILMPRYHGWLRDGVLVEC